MLLVTSGVTTEAVEERGAVQSVRRRDTHGGETWFWSTCLKLSLYTTYAIFCVEKGRYGAMTCEW